jgi:hypothetical protein
MHSDFGRTKPKSSIFSEGRVVRGGDATARDKKMQNPGMRGLCFRLFEIRTILAGGIDHRAAAHTLRNSRLIARRRAQTLSSHALALRLS